MERYIVKSEDLPIDTPCMVSDTNNDWRLAYYAGNGKVFVNGYNSIYTPHVCEWRYTVPFSKFNPDNIEDSLKHNIV